MVFSNLFAPADNVWGFNSMQIGALMVIIMGGGTIIALLSKTYVIIPMMVLGFSFFNMITKSYGFFNKLFTNWNSTELVYLSLCFGVGLVIIVIITIIEMPSHGRSGS